MTEAGANCTLAYTYGGVQYAFAARCVAIGHGVQVMASESQARRYRAFYPRQVVPAQFTLGFVLRAKRQLAKYKTVRVAGKDVANVSEYERFNGFLRDYADRILAENPLGAAEGLSAMTVACPARNFFRYGLPLGPFQYGDHVGSMLFQQSITFETAQDPTTPLATSQFQPLTTQADRNAAYFYPMSPQLHGSDAPLVFDTPQTLQPVSSGAVTGAILKTDSPTPDQLITPRPPYAAPSPMLLPQPAAPAPGSGGFFGPGTFSGSGNPVPYQQVPDTGLPIPPSN